MLILLVIQQFDHNLVTRFSIITLLPVMHILQFKQVVIFLYLAQL